jgi:hypothetical protein
MRTCRNVLPHIVGHNHPSKRDKILRARKISIFSQAARFFFLTKNNFCDLMPYVYEKSLLLEKLGRTVCAVSPNTPMLLL